MNFGFVVLLAYFSILVGLLVACAKSIGYRKSWGGLAGPLVRLFLWQMFLIFLVVILNFSVILFASIIVEEKFRKETVDNIENNLRSCLLPGVVMAIIEGLLKSVDLKNTEIFVSFHFSQIAFMVGGLVLIFLSCLYWIVATRYRGYIPFAVTVTVHALYNFIVVPTLMN